MGKVQGLVRQAVRRRGLSLGRYPHTGSIDDHLAEVFAGMGVRHVLDVGANDGAYGRRLREDVGFTGTVSSFEPTADVFARLAAAAARDPRWHVHPYALGDEAGPAVLHRSAMSELNSLHVATPYGRDVFGADQAATETVQVRRLDEVWPEVLGPDAADQPVFLKTDTQGHDLAVLAGAAGVLSQLAGLQLEVPLHPVYESMPSLAEVLATLEQQGFVCSGIFTVTRGPGLRLVEVDVVAVRGR